MKITLTMTDTLRRFFKALDTSNIPLESLQIFPTKDFVDIGGIDVGRVRLSMLRIPYKTEESEPIIIEPIFLLKILGKLRNEEFTIEDFGKGVKLLCSNREMTFTETINSTAIKPYSLDKIYKNTHNFCEFTLEWNIWSQILSELNSFGNMDCFNIYTEDGNIVLFSEERHYTYKRTIINLSECRKNTHIKSVYFALRNFDRRIKSPVKIQIADNEPICLTFEDNGIILRQWIAPRMIDEDEDDD